MKKTTKSDVRYDREEALKRVSSLLEQAHKYNLTFEIAGSFRRGLETVGDIDIVARLEEVYRWIWICGFLKAEPWSIGERMCDFGLEDGFPVNIRFFSAKEWGAGLLFLTGSKQFNIICRVKANELGLTLNQYDLYEGDKALGLGKKEHWLLEKLGLLDYILPESRN